MFPGNVIELAALFLLISGVTAVGGGMACGVFSELSCSEVATSDVTLWT